MSPITAALQKGNARAVARVFSRSGTYLERAQINIRFGAGAFQGGFQLLCELAGHILSRLFESNMTQHEVWRVTGHYRQAQLKRTLVETVIGHTGNAKPCGQSQFAFGFNLTHAAARALEVFLRTSDFLTRGNRDAA